jgi:hypothetical protein
MLDLQQQRRPSVIGGPSEDEISNTACVRMAETDQRSTFAFQGLVATDAAQQFILPASDCPAGALDAPGGSALLSVCWLMGLAAAPGDLMPTRRAASRGDSRW